MGRFTLALSCLMVLVSAVAAWEAWSFIHAEFPDVSALKRHYPVVVYRGPKEPFTVKLQKAPPAGWTSLGQVSPVAIGAILVSEDWAFFNHKGYDASQIKAVVREGVQEGRFSRGASTITQQVVKNVFLERDRNLWRKFKELILAVRLEERVGKRRILETYLNIAEWGEGVFGIRAAAHKYFKKDPSQLNAREGAFLAMLLPSPKRYSQSFHRRTLSPFARRTMTSVLGKMEQAHYLSGEQLQVELSRRLWFEGDSALAGAPDEQLEEGITPERDL